MARATRAASKAHAPTSPTVEAPQGAWHYNCEVGYDLVESEPSNSTCERAVSGPLPWDIIHG